MRTTLIFLIIIIICPLVIFQGRTMAQENPLDNYIREGFRNNLVLQQKNVSLEKALLALKTAKGMFLPEANFQMSYQTADGGRNIPLPLGDLLNETYATLNDLTGTQDFPQLNNESVNFLPKNYYDARVHTTVPIINADLFYNRKIKEQQVVLQEYEVEIYRRELVKNIKSAYYNYLSTLKTLDIYESSLQLAEEGKRVNEKLLENGKGLPAYVLRAKSEIASVEAQITSARQHVKNARLYFNSLLDREAGAPIDIAFDEANELAKASTQLKINMQVDGREELKSLAQLVELNTTVVKMNEKYLVPKLNGFLDLGSQAEGWKFSNQSRYYMAGLQLNIPIFSGGQNHQKIKQARLKVQDSRLNLAQANLQLNVSANVAYNNLKAAWETYRSSQLQLEAAETYQRLIDRGYRNGTNTYIETVDARNQLISARMSSTINKYSILIAAAELERETASYQIIKKQVQ